MIIKRIKNRYIEKKQKKKVLKKKGCLKFREWYCNKLNKFFIQWIEKVCV